MPKLQIKLKVTSAYFYVSIICVRILIFDDIAEENMVKISLKTYLAWIKISINYSSIDNCRKVNLIRKLFSKKLM